MKIHKGTRINLSQNLDYCKYDGEVIKAFAYNNFDLYVSFEKSKGKMGIYIIELVAHKLSFNNATFKVTKEKGECFCRAEFEAKAEALEFCVSIIENNMEEQ